MADRVIMEVRQELGQYASTISLSSPDDIPGLRQAESRLDDLVGVPRDEIITDVIGRLRGGEWLADWSKRHYGNIIKGTSVVHRSTPFILLAGDPGTGKSALAHNIAPVVARSLNNRVLFVELNARLRGTGIQGRAGTEVVNVFDAISSISGKHSVPTLVFLDEAEAVAGSRTAGDGSSGAQENVAVVDALIVALDRVFARSETKLVFITATNLFGRIDTAVSRRATIYHFERPSSEQRRMILRQALVGSADPAILDAVNSAMERNGHPLTAADVLNQVVGRVIREAAHEDRPIDPDQLLALARGAIATMPVGLTP
jgi:AAA+ superfamily predicted ATPase